MTQDEIHAYAHNVVRVRVTELAAGELTGRPLAIAQNLLAHTLIGHARIWPSCPASVKVAEL